MQMTREDNAAAIARHIVICAAFYSRRHFHLSMRVTGGPPLPPLPVNISWRRGKAVGMTFSINDLAAAMEWARRALLADYEVCWQTPRKGGGDCYSIDMNFKNVDMAYYLEQLARRRIKVPTQSTEER